MSAYARFNATTDRNARIDCLRQSYFALQSSIVKGTCGGAYLDARTEFNASWRALRELGFSPSELVEMIIGWGLLEQDAATASRDKKYGRNGR